MSVGAVVVRRNFGGVGSMLAGLAVRVGLATVCAIGGVAGFVGVLGVLVVRVLLMWSFVVALVLQVFGVVVAVLVL